MAQNYADITSFLISKIVRIKQVPAGTEDWLKNQHQTNFFSLIKNNLLATL